MLAAVIKRRTSKGLWRALRSVREEWGIQRTHRRSLAAATRLKRDGPVRLNLGSGYHPKPGWINVDLLAPQADLRLDLREPLPFADNSVAAIYSEHFFEHLNYAQLADSMAWHLEAAQEPSEALTFLRECKRVLQPGGMLDIVVPDVEGILQEYVGRREKPFPGSRWWGPAWCDTPLHCVNYVFRQGSEHKYAYDAETLEQILDRTGFVDVRRRPFDPTIDAENHEIGSLCMLAMKPSATGARQAPPLLSRSA
jgi:predicted SAM-dependent methyltransferase